MTDYDDKRHDRSGAVTRRTVLGVGVAGATVLTMAACTQAPPPTVVAVSSGDATAGSSGSNPTSSPTDPSSSAGSRPSPPASASAPAGTGKKALAKLADIPIGSAVAAKGASSQDILITRTAATEVVAFSAICPHMGCTVPPSFACPCHGSTFDPKTGARLGGPAPTGLSPVSVSVSGPDIVAG
ncbi:Rieske (2Fe-2S) protein [Jatrophihabitans sp. DSM 45814]